jgi:cell fate (sporulation/competence/biofilm development) regulator YlbF (YheA/YmcA/DUF963 family)
VVEEDDMDTQTTIPPSLLAAANELGESLARAEPVVALEQAKARLDADERARGLLSRMSEIDAELRGRQADGTLTREDIDRARQAHVDASSDPTIQGLVAAQQEASAYLPEVNELISELLGLDFASIAAAPTSC